ncbi:hypothetical protein [Bacillus cereus]|uniref:hypothetical protein n=1 Tax=Bacillus cereus TaxID=1396 RepID=UPI003654B8E8
MLDPIALPTKLLLSHHDSPHHASSAMFRPLSDIFNTGSASWYTQSGCDTAAVQTFPGLTPRQTLCSSFIFSEKLRELSEKIARIVTAHRGRV